MSRSPAPRRLALALFRAWRTAVVAAALLAFLHVTLPHAHAGSADERHCPACQVSRLDAVGLPEAGAGAVAPPVGAVVRSPRVDVAPVSRAAHGAPLPSRGPPPASPSEPL